MLPVLKEAGVVDSGGQGLLEVFRGAIDGFLGKEIDYTEFAGTSAGLAVTKISPQAEADIKFGYCTEFIMYTPIIRVRHLSVHLPMVRFPV